MPLQIPDQNIATQVQVANPMQSIGSMLNIANGAQRVQGQQIANETNQRNLDERNNLRSLFQDPKQLMDDQGDIDFNKAAPAIMSAAPTQGGQVISGLITAQNQAIQTRKEINSLTNDQRTQVGQFAMSLGNDDPATGMAKMDALKQSYPNLSNAIDFAKQHLLAPAANNPQAWKQATLQIGQSIMSPDSQRAAMTPTGVAVSNNQQSSVVNTNPMAGQVGQAIPGTQQQQQLPPLTPVFNPETNAPGYLGPQGGSSVQSETGGLDVSKLSPLQQQFLAKQNPQAFANGMDSFQKSGGSAPARGSVQSGPSLGAGTGAEGTAQVINKHYGDISSMAQTAPQDIGVLQNIISHAHGAATGVTGEREALISGLAGRLGMTSAEMAKTDTDLLAKNSAMLQLAGGDTNLAKTLAGAANPNNHMTEDAIRQAAYQVIGQKQMSIAAQKLFTPLKELADHGSPGPYNQVMQKFNSAADPRILQLPYMTPEERQKMKASMTPQEQKDFRDKISTLQSLGVAK